MSTFNPLAAAPTDQGASEQATVNENLPSGDYLIRIVWFSRQTSRADNEYLRVKWEILAGEYANNAFFANLSCKVDAGGVRARWVSLCKGLNINEAGQHITVNLTAP